MLGATFIGKEPSWGGSSANGKGWSRKRRAAVPSEARRLARLLRPLEANPPGSDDGAEGRHDAISIVLTVVEKVASVSVDISRFERLLRANLDKTKQRHSDTDTTPQDESLCTAVAIHQVFHQRNTFKFTLPRKSFVDAGDKAEPDLDGDTSIDGQHKRRKTAYNMFFAEFARKVDAEARSLNKIVVGGYASLAREEWGKLSDDEKATYARKANRRNLAATHTCSLLQTAPPGTMDAPATTTTTEREVSKSETITFVSDSESARSTSTAVDNSQISRKEDHLDPDSLWRSFVECLRIEALSRIPPSAWRDTADTFDVYRFHQPVRIQNTSSHVLQRLCEKIQQYFLSAYDGYQSGSLRRTRGRKRAAKGCRVYTVWDDKNGALLIQICVGGALHGTTTSVSELEFTAVAEPNCCCVALSSGSGHSGKRVIPVVLSALEACLAQFDQTGGGSLYDPTSYQPLQGLSGADPFNSLRAAKAIVEETATGRLAYYASKNSEENPISDLQFAATAQLVAGNVSGSDMTRTSGTRVVTKRKRSDTCESELGRPEDCPRRESIRWDWKGTTKAASVCWYHSGDEASAGQEEAETPDSVDACDTNRTKFKCRVVLQGADVLAGLRALSDAGLVKTPLPSYIRDASRLGGTIRVEDGAVLSSDTKS